VLLPNEQCVFSGRVLLFGTDVTAFSLGVQYDDVNVVCVLWACTLDLGDDAFEHTELHLWGGGHTKISTEILKGV
jgi:uncharacterized membrane protein YccF (DUF307 family)